MAAHTDDERVAGGTASALAIRMMRRCIALAARSGEMGEYPYAAVICRGGEIICESINPVTRDGDVTRHAEIVAISEAQKALRTTSLDDCAIYMNAEPCALCSYAIRESRIGRALFGLSSPVMGGFSRWNILGDTLLSDKMPDVFAPPPEIHAGFLRDEAEASLKRWSPIAYHVIRSRGLFGALPPIHAPPSPRGVKARAMAVLRRRFFDRFGRR